MTIAKKGSLNIEQVNELKVVKSKNKDKNVDARLRALLLYAEGQKSKDIAAKTGFKDSYISELVRKYRKGGIAALCGKNYKGNRRNLSFAQEAALLSDFEEKAKAGQVITVADVKTAYEKAIGRSLDTSRGQIYRVLERHGWRKVMPRSKHPNKADEATIDASKKLTLLSEKHKWQKIT